ncbi:hypothetical protein [Pararhodospirillum photometricum]|uniref:Uncharacterized protein n=1 Tax=Pararhodospirillum photometricum DSM 122 TaxID=1150469 RepID=H6SN10_PARPM|nr:hypothetical protein [Pararhodospirillum photometricum]CCG06886.1 unnamed protein product [Pararhodospirillum photometricum DSM 122]
MERVAIDVPEGFSSFVEPALVRLGYLYPSLKIFRDENSLVLEAPEGLETCAAEVRYQLYRERIYQETLPIRCCLYEGLVR